MGTRMNKRNVKNISDTVSSIIGTNGIKRKKLKIIFDWWWKWLKWKWKKLKPRIRRERERNNVSSQHSISPPAHLPLLPPAAAPPPGLGAAAPLLLPPDAPPPRLGHRAGAHPLVLHQPAHHLQVASLTPSWLLNAPKDAPENQIFHFKTEKSCFSLRVKPKLKLK